MKEILRIFTLIALSQVVLLTIHLFRLKGNSLSRLILIVLFVSFSIFLAGNILIFYSEISMRYKIAHILNLTVFLTAPLLYLYTRAGINERKFFKTTDLYHFVPFIIVMGYMIFRLFISSQKLPSFRPYGIALLTGLFIQNLLYFYSIRRILNQQSVSRIENKNNSESQIYSLINKMFYLFFGILLTQLGVFISCNIFKYIDICTVFTGLFFLITFILVNNIVLFGLSGSSVFIRKEKYINNSLKDEIKQEYIKKLIHILENEKVYMNPLLTLERLSRITLIPKNILSQIINEKFEMNFNDLVNQYRINAAKEYLTSANHTFNILEIAYEVGFNSKSTFNTAFKRFTGVTPSEYVNRQAILN